MNAVIDAVQPRVPDQSVREEIYRPIIQALEDGDWDTHDESMDKDPAFDAVLRSKYPSWFKDDA